MGLGFDWFFWWRTNVCRESYYKTHVWTVSSVCTRYMPKWGDSAGEMVVEIFLELFSRDVKKLPTEKKELIDFAIASLLKKSKQQLTTMYASREQPSYSMLHAEWQMFLEYMKDISASEMIDTLQNLPHLEQVVYALAAIDGYTSTQIAKMIGGEEPKVDALITGARRHILENLLKLQTHNSVENCSVFEE